MSQINAIIESATVMGSGNNLYTIVMVDRDDSEDTSIQLWRADDEDHLYDQALEDFQGDTDESFKESLAVDFENEIWGLLWLPKYIGSVK
jgi:hypothetical protein